MLKKFAQVQTREKFTVSDNLVIYRKIDPIMQSCCQVKFDSVEDGTQNYVLIGKDTVVETLED